MQFIRSLKKKIMGARRSNNNHLGNQNYILKNGALLGAEGVIENIHGPKNFVCLGDKTYCRGRLLTYGHGGEISIGKYCYIGLRTEIWSMCSIKVGDRVLISHDVNIHDGTAHSLDASERHRHFKHILEKGHPLSQGEMPGVLSSPIVIEDDVWISFGVTVLKGVRIGAKSVISAGSIVTNDVPPGSIYRNKIEPIIEPLRT